MKNNTKKVFVSLIFFMFFGLIIFNFQNFNENKTSVINYEKIISTKNKTLYLDTDAEKEIEENVENQLNGIDFSGLENIINNIDNRKGVFANNSFLDLVKKFINAENSNLSSDFFSYIMGIIFDDIISFLPFFAIIVVIAVIYSMIGQFSMGKNSSISDLIHIVCFSSIAVIVLKIISSEVIEVTKTLSSIENQMEIIFPIILTLMSAIGSVVTATTFQPMLAVLSVGITKVFTVVLIPIFIFSIIFGIVGNLSKTVRMEKFSKFFSSLFNWIVGIIFTVFMAFLTLHGLTVSTVDTISLRTTKFAIKSYLPLGSYLSDGMGLIVASSILIKNSIGATGLVLLLVTIFAPILRLAILMLLLKLVSSIIETLCNDQISNFLYSVSKSLNMLNICLIAVGFMYLISVSILMCCSNVF